MFSRTQICSVEKINKDKNKTPFLHWYETYSTLNFTFVSMNLQFDI